VASDHPGQAALSAPRVKVLQACRTQQRRVPPLQETGSLRFEALLAPLRDTLVVSLAAVADEFIYCGQTIETSVDRPDAWSFPVLVNDRRESLPVVLRSRLSRSRIGNHSVPASDLLRSVDLEVLFGSTIGSIAPSLQTQSSIGFETICAKLAVCSVIDHGSHVLRIG